MTPDWQLPPGVDRGLWDYMHSAEMAAGYDEHLAASPLARQDVAFCERHFPQPGRMIDLGCGTGRLCVHFADRGFECVGVDLSPEMLARAPRHPHIEWVLANILELRPEQPFDYAACLFSTFGMIRTDVQRQQLLAGIHAILKPGGVFVLHAHNRWYAPLGFRRFLKREFTMPQNYAGAGLTLRHFSRGELRGMLRQSGFGVIEEQALAAERNDPPRRPWRIYGFLVACRRL